MIDEDKERNDDVTSNQKSNEYEMYDHLKDTLNGKKLNDWVSMLDKKVKKLIKLKEIIL